MRVPYENWVKYLIVTGMSKRDIVKTLELSGAPVPDGKYLSDLQTRVNKGRPKPLKKGSKEANSWYRGHRILAICTDEKVAERMRSLHGTPRVREALETLIAAGLEKEDVAKYLKEATGEKATPKECDLYRLYFWNLDNMTTGQLVSFFSVYPNGSTLEECWLTGAEYALWTLGIRVPFDKDALLNTMVNEAAVRFIQTGRMRNSRDTAMTAKMWSEIIFNAYDEQSKSGNKLREIINELKGLTMRTDEKRVPSIDEITGGNHSDLGGTGEPPD
jgi:hypothetical protein